MRRRRSSLYALVLALLVALGLCVPVTAASATINYCGSGYAFQQQVVKPLGTLTLYYSSATGKNCATLVSTSTAYGTAHPMYVSLMTTSATVCDPVGAPLCGAFGTYRYYAGPVYLSAPGVCVRAYAAYRWPDINGPETDLDTGYGHCN